MVPSEGENDAPKAPPPLPPTVEAFARNTIPTARSRPMTEALPPPQARYLNQKEPSTARAATMAPPASTCRPPTRPPRRCWTTITVEEEKGNITSLPMPDALTQDTVSSTSSYPSRPGASRPAGFRPQPTPTPLHQHELSPAASSLRTPTPATTAVGAGLRHHATTSTKTSMGNLQDRVGYRPREI
jgi:hypothetical protein